MTDLEPSETPELDPAPASSFDNALIGDVLQIASEQEVPADWHVCDGTTLFSRQRPLFTEALRIQGPTFTLPTQRAPEGHLWIIKIGVEVRPKLMTDPSRMPEGPLRDMLMARMNEEGRDGSAGDARTD